MAWRDTGILVYLERDTGCYLLMECISTLFTGINFFSPGYNTKGIFVKKFENDW